MIKVIPFVICSIFGAGMVFISNRLNAKETRLIEATEKRNRKESRKPKLIGYWSE